MCKVYTDVGGIKQLYQVCPPVRVTIHSLLKLVEYLYVQANKPRHNYYLTYPYSYPTMVNVKAPVVATTSWLWTYFPLVLV